MRKKSTLVKTFVRCFLKSTRPVYYQLHLNLIKTSLKTIFLKNTYFCIFNQETLGLPGICLIDDVCINQPERAENMLENKVILVLSQW